MVFERNKRPAQPYETSTPRSIRAYLRRSKRSDEPSWGCGEASADSREHHRSKIHTTPGKDSFIVAPGERDCAYHLAGENSRDCAGAQFEPGT
jgi:hypothetical protein